MQTHQTQVANLIAIDLELARRNDQPKALLLALNNTTVTLTTLLKIYQTPTNNQNTIPDRYNIQAPRTMPPLQNPHSQHYYQPPHLDLTETKINLQALKPPREKCRVPRRFLPRYEENKSQSHQSFRKRYREYKTYEEEANYNQKEKGRQRRERRE